MYIEKQRQKPEKRKKKNEKRGHVTCTFSHNKFMISFFLDSHNAQRQQNLVTIFKLSTHGGLIFTGSATIMTMQQCSLKLSYLLCQAKRSHHKTYYLYTEAVTFRRKLWSKFSYDKTYFLLLFSIYQMDKVFFLELQIDYSL